MSDQTVQRFGDRSPPVLPGIYEFFGRRYGKHLGAKNVEVEVILFFDTPCVMEAYPVGMDFYEGRWWGPYPDSTRGSVELLQK